MLSFLPSEDSGMPNNPPGHDNHSDMPTLPAQQPLTAEDLLERLHQRINQLESQLHSATAQPSFQPTYMSHGIEPKISGPAPFSGRKEEALEFLLKCDMVFNVQARTYAANQSKIAYVTNLLKDEAYRWIMPYLAANAEDQPYWLKDWNGFKEEFKKVFGDTEIGETARHKLKHLRQTGPATSYATEFRRHAAYLHYSDEALRHLFFDGLKEDVKDKLLTPNACESYEDLIDLAIKWDNLLFQRRRNASSSRPAQRIDNLFAKSRPVVNNFRPTYNNSQSAPAQSTHTPMEIDAVRPRFAPLSQKEKDHRRANNLCLYCGKSGHVANNCNARVNPSSKPRINANTTAQTKNVEPQA